MMPKLSQEAIEYILVAVSRATNTDGMIVHVMLEDIFTEEFLKQIPHFVGEVATDVTVKH